MSAPCGCHPGTPENGWHETRSPACRAAELEAWRRVVDALPRIIESLRKSPMP